MGRMGYGYGSEWQLLRFLGRHRSLLTREVAAATGLSDIEWLDFRFKPSDPLGDGELLGLEFLQDDDLRAEWSCWWPTGRGIMNWDAIATGAGETGTSEWILVEAKGNLEELRSNCGAGAKSLAKIQAAFTGTRAAMGITDSNDWAVDYYQHANRLAVLHFLNSRGIPARLVYVLFVGATELDERSPIDADGWRRSIDEMKTHLGLTGSSDLERRVHEVYIDVGGEQRSV